MLSVKMRYMQVYHKIYGEKPARQKNIFSEASRIKLRFINAKNIYYTSNRQ